MPEDVFDDTLEDLKIIINDSTIFLTHKINIGDINKSKKKFKYYLVKKNIIINEINKEDIDDYDLYLNINSLNKNLTKYYSRITTPRGLCNNGDTCFFNSAAMLSLFPLLWNS